jgi:hypothetical protein
LDTKGKIYNIAISAGTKTAQENLKSCFNRFRKKNKEARPICM